MSDNSLKKQKKKKKKHKTKKQDLLSERLKIDTKLLSGQLYGKIKKKTFGEH